MGCFFTGLDAAQILRNIKSNFMEGTWHANREEKRRMAREAGVKLRVSQSGSSTNSYSFNITMDEFM